MEIIDLQNLIFFDQIFMGFVTRLPGVGFRRFKATLGDFIIQLVRQCAQAELLYDEFMMDYVLQLLSEMSASHVRPFRHTGTFCAMKLMSALVGVALNVNKEIEDTTKQYEGEINKVNIILLLLKLNQLIILRIFCEIRKLPGLSG